MAPLPRSAESGAITSKMDCWMLRTVALALAAAYHVPSAAATELGLEVNNDLTAVTAEVASNELPIEKTAGVGNIVADLLASDREGKSISLLEYWSQSLSSFAGSFDMLLAEFGLPTTSVVCVALAATVLAFILIRKAGSLGSGSGGGSGSMKRKGILFLGPCGAGKTAMMHRLCHDRMVDTVTSMQACTYLYRDNYSNRARSRSGGPSTALIDYPGHERLRGGLGEELRRAERVVFVLDGSCLASQVSAAAELFYDVVSDPSMDSCKGLLVALNKSDLKEAKATRAKMLLQKEVEKLRGTRDTLGTQGEEDDLPTAMVLGRPGQPFSLEVDSPCEVVMTTCSVKNGSLDGLVDFMGGSAR